MNILQIVQSKVVPQDDLHNQVFVYDQEHHVLELFYEAVIFLKINIIFLLKKYLYKFI